MLLPALSLTLLLSALLLFAVQPLVAKLLLPLLGGAPMVWNTCMVFFQALLLGGYGYAHWLSGRGTVRRQSLVHLGFLGAGLFCLPMSLAADANPAGKEPLLWLLGTLFGLVGIPFLVLSASAPLLQNWFSRSGHPAAKDPYFLYAASNFGSFLALLGYPLLAEPMLRLSQQTWSWSVGYGLLLLAFIGVTVLMWKRDAGATTQTVGEKTESKKATWKQRGIWILLSLLPSSLMLGLTTYLTTDIASVPLLWTLPLALYLLTFIIVFAKVGERITPMAARVLPVAAVIVLFLLLGEIKHPAGILVPLHLAVFFLITLALHGKLASLRPEPSQLTEYYLCMSIGGVLGGLLNALVAPLVFKSVVEYPLAIALACLVAPPADGKLPEKKLPKQYVWPVAIGLLTAIVAKFLPGLSRQSHQLAMFLIFGVPLVVAFFLSRRPVVFGLTLGAIIWGASFYTAIHGQTLHAERNFFGALRVTMDPDGHIRRFYHGTTVHGIQFVDPKRQDIPLSYYHPNGPAGAIMDFYQKRKTVGRVAAIGLGAGALAAYAKENEEWTFYEIDPAVLRIASDTNWFTYLNRCGAKKLTHKIGDGRLLLRDEPDHHFDLIVCDAFSSDVPPLHLITKEALQEVRQKLAPGGIILFNISSRLLNFRPVLGNIAKELNMDGYSLNEGVTAEETMRFGRYSSHWAVMAADAQTLQPLSGNQYWKKLEPEPTQPVWSDDYYNILGIFDWK
ncbi:MAG TPA: fused MFS/spermidine synthase [Verrucomicrobiae bacterium]